MAIKKIAVAPVHPSAVGLEPIAAPMIPTNWQGAFARLVDSVTIVVTAQAKKVADLTQALADANGLIAALTKKQADDYALLAKGLVGQNIAGIRDEASEIRADLTDIAGKVEALIKGRAEIVDNVRATDKRIDALPSVHETVAKVGEMVAAGYEHSIKLITDMTVEKVTALEAAAGAARDIAEAVRDEVRTVATGLGDLTETHTATRRQLDALASDVNDIGEDLGGKVSALTKGHSDLTAANSENAAANSKLAAVVTEHVDRLGANLGTLEERVEDAAAKFGDKVSELKDLVEDYASTASSEDAGLADQLGKLDGHVTAAREVADAARTRAAEAMSHCNDLSGTVSAIIKARADEADQFAETVETVGNQVKTMVDDLAAQFGEMSQMSVDDAKRIEQVEETARTIGAEVQGLAKVIEACRDAGAEIATDVTDMLRRVTISLGQMPSGFMIDQDGELVRVAQSGEVTKIGKVVSHGRDAPEIVSVKMEGERLIFARSDRTEIGCTVVRATVEPAPAITGPDAVDPLTIGALSKDPALLARQVEHMAEMRAGGKKYKEISEKFGTSEKTVAKLIRGYQNAQTKKDA